ncbi:MAG TPA: energy-coupling factor transporter transmembrane component T [Candidatus Acidoferrum sp.]|nr:energy-coupling factor transporter transmembrane component T [Candidatus Acidoferrum sp.]
MSLKVFDGFKFAKLPTPVHRMDPRAKFIMTMGIFATALLFSNVYALIVVFLVQLPIVYASKSWRKWVGSMRAGALLAVLIFVMNFVFGSTFVFSAAMTLRFISLMSTFSLFFMTTSPDDLGLALEQAHVPYTLSFTFTTAVRLVPTMALDAQTVIDAQRSRGLELDKGNFMKRIRNYIPILIPLIVSAIRRSIELAEALESRGFGASPNRQPLIVLRMKTTDYLIIAFTILMFALAVYVYLYVRLPVLSVPITMPKIVPWL